MSTLEISTSFSVKIHPDTEDETTTTVSTRSSSPDDGQSAINPAEPKTCTADGQPTSSTSCPRNGSTWRAKTKEAKGIFVTVSDLGLVVLIVL